MLVAVVLVAPDLIEQVEPRKHFARMTCEEMKQVELARREFDRLAVDAHLAR